MSALAKSMSDDRLAVLAVLGAVTLGALSFGPVPELAFVLQASGVGAILATALGLRKRYRGAPEDRTTVVAVGAVLGAAVGGIAVVLDALITALA